MDAHEARTYGRHAAPTGSAGAEGRPAQNSSSRSGTAVAGGTGDERPAADEQTLDGTHPLPGTDTEPGSGADPTDEPPGARPRRSGRTGRRSLLRRALIGGGVLALVVAVLIGGVLWFVSARYVGNIDRIENVFGGLEESNRPEAPTTTDPAGAAPVTFLLVGSDTRGHPANGEDPDGRSDAIMVARLSGDRQHAQLISIPRDSWVNIPGYGMNKINASYAYGGPTLLIATVELITGVRIDHYVAVDFDGIAEITDALGGVDVDVAETTTNGMYTFTAGVNHITGDQARWYLGQRKNLVGGDFDRVKRQQQYLQAVFEKLSSAGVLTDPLRLDSVLRAMTGAVSIDDTLRIEDLIQLAGSLRNLTPENVMFFTAPVLGTGREGAASVVYLDTVTGDRMWSYLRSDSLWQNAGEFSRQALPEVPN